MKAAAFTFAWTPPQAGRLGSIMLRQRPESRLTWVIYWYALSERINRMIAAEGRGEAIRIFREQDPSDALRVDENHIATAGFGLVEFNDSLRERVHFPRDGVPVGELSISPRRWNLCSAARIISGIFW